ncbi:Fe-S-containing hydro-lyase [Sedimentibacter hydroxybenzoicus DSM 7310]|uniref:Fe-S-containing hydro-lyase n=1 Tax=Sedimentibacter hydroxybenzoicus DSM 7310 TaxID=1123245 RepID=A0A974GWS5_SEDHY|nr:Fe-S-containing hydro-lyase [Sedimentibacter hydroxybenzoicus]NYB74812.1 Fe-S-containing hydro-lyase [Sedimentibacter hydroxybenzoicus DSM 7310]
MVKKVDTPLTDEVINELRAGDRVLLSGIIYTGRDAAHKRLAELINKGEELPMDIKNQTIYYVGPCPAKPGQVIGSAGPTTSGRMDAYAPLLIDEGLKGMIGKGLRNQQVVDSIVKNNAVYFAAVGGAGALLAEAIKEAEVIAFSDLGAEAIYKLRIEDFPVTVIIDNQGNDLYKIGKEKYKII